MEQSNEAGAAREMPFLMRWPIIAGAIVGVLLRLAFSGHAGSPWSAMAGAFIYIAPVVVGMTTVYLAERQRRRSWSYYLFAPAFATLLFVGGTLLILIEGLICAVVIVPMFCAMGAAGGLAMGIVCRLTNWPRPMLHSFAALPLLLGLLGTHVPTPDAYGVVERSLQIQAPAAVVWRQLNDMRDIRTDEVGHALAYRIGVPLPLSGVTRETPQGRVRTSLWDKNVHFEEVIQEWEEARHMRWTYRFAPDSFPAGALDDHVLIGGHYFDLIDTAFTLVPNGDATRLDIRVRYRISTQFNFYADWVAQWLLGDFSETGLGLYRARSEAAEAVERLR